MGLADWFSTFCTNIQVQDGGTISTRYKAITRRLNTDFWITMSDTVHSLYVGSYGRNTAGQGFSDLDMLSQLPYALYERYNRYIGNGQSALLQVVKASIEKTYSKTSIKADGQVILVPFTDDIREHGDAGDNRRTPVEWPASCTYYSTSEEPSHACQTPACHVQ